MEKKTAKKSSNLQEKKNSDLKIMALGGLGEVGKNCYVIEYKKDIFIIDFGVIFPDKDHLGIDYIVPNYNYLKENQSRIKGVFITHGHEDHIGGIPFLVKQVKVPAIYAPLTAKLMIEKKFKEHKVECPLYEINATSKLRFGDVVIETFRQAHSIPDSYGLFFDTPLGNVVTTGDFKVDFSPPGQKTNDFHKMTELANRGVLCLMSDSTNSMTQGFSMSESVVGQNLKTLIYEAEGRIIFTTFASNINRVQQIIEGALENNRKICILGRSLSNALQIGQKTGYMQVKPKDLVDAKQVKKYAPEEVCIICTGSQGESLAALSRIANGLNPNITLDTSDTVVFASNPIPGNNYPIGRVIDALSKANCKVIKNSAVFNTHASGHASQEEQKLLLSLWQPKFFLPIHGTYNMLLSHKKTALQLGWNDEDIYIMDNGDFFNLNQTRPYITRKEVPGTSIFISGNNIDVDLGNGTMQKLASDGIVIFSVIYDRNKNLISYPQTITRGFVVINESLPLLKKIQTTFLETYHANKHLKEEELKMVIDVKMAEYILKETKKQPLVSTNLIKYNPLKNVIRPEKKENSK